MMNLDRRELLRWFSLAPWLVMAELPSSQRSRSLTLARNALVVDGVKRFLIGGSTDYFRCPRELWRDRLLKMKRAGLNAVATCVAWNFHEREERVYDFSGDRDIEHFLDLCHELGLFVFVRPGPFVCDEWEAGGYPAWLIGKPGVETRTDHPATLAHVRRWFEQLIPRIAARQVTRGGSVILVQQENEFFFVGRPGIREYQDFLIHTLRDLGITVPISDCSGFHAETRRPESLQTVNGWSLSAIERFRHENPNSPAIVSEFYTHWMETWGKPEEAGPGAAALQRQTHDCLAACAMPFYFMFHGGTSFGSWASRTWKSDDAFITPRYYGRGPIAEGGALNDTYFAVKAVSLPASSLEFVLAGSETVALPVTLTGPAQALARRSSRGTILFVAERTDHAEARGKPALLQLPSGKSLELAFRPETTAILPFELKLDDKRRIDYSNAALVVVTESAVVIAGEEGKIGAISINGEPAEFVFGPEAKSVRAGGALVVAIPHSQAGRTWQAGGRILIGPAYVGEQRNGRHECWCDPETRRVQVISQDGSFAVEEVSPPSADNREIALGGWSGRSFAETRGEETWRPLSGPRPVEDLGADWGYSWYKARFHAEAHRRSALMFTNATDRIHVFRGGQRIGVWGRGEGASRDPLPLELPGGDHEFVFLCDNMGRSSEGSCIDRKGIAGPVHLDAREPEVQWASEPAPANPPSNSWQYRTYQDRTPGKSLWRITGELTVEEGQTLVVSVRSLPQYAWLEINGQPLGEHGGDLSLIDGFSFSTHTRSDLAPGRVILSITGYGDPVPEIRPHVRIFTCPKSGSLGAWGFRPFSWPTGHELAREGAPARWECTFAGTDLHPPLFFEPRGLSKGMVFLNGRDVGRYWSIGPQTRLYLPEPWLRDQNQLVVIDENGLDPSKSLLVRDARVSTRPVMI